MTHEVVLQGYNVKPGSLQLGTFDSYGIEEIHVTADDEWAGLGILAVFHAPNGTAKKVVVGADGMLAVPPEATAKQAGVGRIVFVGLAENVQRITVDIGYNIKPHSDIEGDNPGTPTPDVVQQILANSNNAVSIATAAQNAAENARQAAEDAAKKAGEGAGGAAASAAAAKKSAEDAAASSESAAGKAEESASSAHAANESAKAAQNAQGSAENAAQTAADAAGVARQAAGEAGSAAKAASTSAGEAAQSAKAAETAKQRAEDAAKKALEAKTGSENALQDADAAKDAASGYADAAAEKATAAAASEKNAAKSANSAADSAAAAKKSAEDADNTANSIKDSMAQISENKEAVSQLKEDTAALKKRQNVLVGSETGNPVSCNDAYSAPLCGLTVYGKSTQDGTPTPDAPVPIVSAGDGGSVAVKVTGKNLYHAAWTGNYSESGLLLTATSTTIAIKGTATEDAYVTRWLVLRDDPIPLDPNKRYTFTPKITGNVFEGLLVYTYDEKGVGTYTGSNIPARSTGVSVYYKKRFKKDETIDFKTSIQLEIGTEATVYEPYREQLLTLPTPNGLPGIPVTSGGNYTDQNGQQWVCDEVDLERGVRVQMVTTMVFSDSSGFAASSTTNGIRFLRAVKNLKITDTDTADANAFCSALALGANGGTWLTPDVFTITKTALYVRFKNITSLGELQQYLQQTPMSLTAILATPIETPLFPAEIAAYKALTAYAPDTVVQASDGAGIKLDYQRDVNLVVKNLEDAIASMTTT